jgi:hypothetical protein
VDHLCHDHVWLFRRHRDARHLLLFATVMTSRPVVIGDRPYDAQDGCRRPPLFLSQAFCVYTPEEHTTDAFLTSALKSAVEPSMISQEPTHRSVRTLLLSQDN